MIAAGLLLSQGLRAEYRPLDAAPATTVEESHTQAENDEKSVERKIITSESFGAPVLTDEITLREIINDIKLIFFSFMAISVGLIAFQIIGYRCYMKQIDKKWAGWFMFAPLWAFIIWVSIIIGIIIGSRYILY